MSQFNSSNFGNISKFDGSYFQVWKHNLKLILKFDKLLKVVDETKVLPTTPSLNIGSTICHKPTTRHGSKNKWHDKDINALTIILQIIWSSIKSLILLRALLLSRHGMNCANYLKHKTL